jgi:hypothetical protein
MPWTSLNPSFVGIGTTQQMKTKGGHSFGWLWVIWVWKLHHFGWSHFEFSWRDIQYCMSFPYDGIINAKLGYCRSTWAVGSFNYCFVSTIEVACWSSTDFLSGVWCLCVVMVCVQEPNSPSNIHLIVPCQFRSQRCSGIPTACVLGACNFCLCLGDEVQGTFRKTAGRTHIVWIY